MTAHRCDVLDEDGGVSLLGALDPLPDVAVCVVGLLGDQAESGVASLSWTPDHCAEEVFRWQRDVPPCAGVPAPDGVRVALVRAGRTPGELAREFECSAQAERNMGPSGGPRCRSSRGRSDERRARGVAAAAPGESPASRGAGDSKTSRGTGSLGRPARRPGGLRSRESEPSCYSDQVRSVRTDPATAAQTRNFLHSQECRSVLSRPRRLAGMIRGIRDGPDAILVHGAASCACGVIG